MSADSAVTYTSVHSEAQDDLEVYPSERSFTRQGLPRQLLEQPQRSTFSQRNIADPMAREIMYHIGESFAAAAARQPGTTIETDSEILSGGLYRLRVGQQGSLTRRERLDYEQDSISDPQTWLGSEAHCMGIKARVTSIRDLRRITTMAATGGQMICCSKHNMRLQALELEHAMTTLG
ncbi:hypothetical protein Tco_0169925 [Tanacetum coccineum]